MIENLASLRTKFLAQASKSNDFEKDDPRRLNHLSLQQQKKRAKELLREWQSSPNNSKQKLSDAQRDIAQANGFRNWPELKAHIEQTDIARHALLSGQPTSLDDTQRTLHIRCGNDIQYAMAIAGFSGDFLVFADPYVHGPVPLTDTLDEFIRIRAQYISADNKPPFAEVYNILSQNYQDLDKARDYEAVYLWNEHDSYDQLILAKLLDYFSHAENRPPLLKMINITHYPGVKKFNGLGQLPAEAMRVLWREFAEVTTEQLSIGQQAWSAICSSTPQALQKLVERGTPELPTIVPALKRHLKQLPSSQNGLNLTENLSLQILNEKGPMNAARLFGWYTNHYEPLTFMGDTGYWQILEDLAGASYPAISLMKKSENPKDWQVEMTPTGSELLANKKDWLTLNAVDRWVGGIHIDTAKDALFRVDA